MKRFTAVVNLFYICILEWSRRRRRRRRRRHSFFKILMRAPQYSIFHGLFISRKFELSIALKH